MNADEVWVVIKQRSPPYQGDWISVSGVFATEVAAKAFIEEARKVREAWTVYDYDSWPVRGAPPPHDGEGAP